MIPPPLSKSGRNKVAFSCLFSSFVYFSHRSIDSERADLCFWCEWTKFFAFESVLSFGMKVHHWLLLLSAIMIDDFKDKAGVILCLFIVDKSHENFKASNVFVRLSVFSDSSNLSAAFKPISSYWRCKSLKTAQKYIVSFLPKSYSNRSEKVIWWALFSAVDEDTFGALVIIYSNM